MRILGFQRMDWMNRLTYSPKLCNLDFTTFRLPRRDRDWEVGEVVQVVLKPRSKEKTVLGVAEIVAKDLKERYGGDNRITFEEARADGFITDSELHRFLFFRPGREDRTANKLTLRWHCWYPPMILFSRRRMYG